VTAPEDKLKIMFLPPNMMSNHQWADMCMISRMVKVGYKLSMLRTLLQDFDEEEGGFEMVVQQWGRQPCGYQGLAYGGKATILDAMEILNKIWNNNGKYATTDGIMCCWRKANILPISWEADINNEVGSSCLLENEDKTISNEECQELCGLLKNLIVRSRETNQNDAACLQDSLLLETTEEEQETLRTKEGDQQLVSKVTFWVHIDDNNTVIEMEIKKLRLEY
jgi:hypothetical protein